MSHDNVYMAEKVISKLVGATITGAMLTPDKESVGFMVEKNGKIAHVWVEADAEGNGSGWLAIEKAA